MQSKKLLFSSLLMLGGMVTFLTMTSSNSGQMGAFSSGCGGGNCHGASSSSTTIALTGFPSTGYIGGQAYPVTLTITNADSTLTHGGFDLKFSGGTISAAPANTMIMGTELHHTSKKAKTGSSVSWSFTWTAPSSATTTLNVSGNMVNGNTQQSGDKWASTTINLVQSTTSVGNTLTSSVEVYPNPSFGNLFVQTKSVVKSIQAIGILGNIIPLTGTAGNGNYLVNTHNLANGSYILLVKTDNGNLTAKFTKL